MQSITREKTFNIGSIAMLKYAAIEHFENIPRSYDGQITADITFKAGYTWLDMEFVRQSASFTETEDMREEGIRYDKRIRLDLNKASYSLQSKLRQLREGKFIFLVFDQNFHETGENPILVGDLDHWMEFTKDRETGRSYQDSNGYRLDFRGRSKFESYSYAGTY